jgi:mannose-1-phosphate guanylyltransferase
MLHAIIMAGGSGTRFWPASRADRPKQLLDLTGEKTMIQATVGRLGELVAPDRVLVVTNERLVAAIRDSLPQLPPEAVIGEPCKRDTAPCVGFSAEYVLRSDENATMAVMPADHVISDEPQFQAAIRYAAELVEQSPQTLVTFGIQPTYAAETFGYIERAEAIGGAGQGGGPPTYRVARFREKPKGETAREYFESGRYYWNSGIFVWKARTIRDALARFEPQMHGHLRAIGEACGREDFDEVFHREFAAIEGKSIDYAVMEHYDDVVVIQAPFPWDDVGSWQSLARLHGTDDENNTVAHARHLGLDTSGTIVRGEDGHLIVTLGVSDCIVVHTPDATLVANKHQEEAIRQVVQLLKEKGWEEYL